MSYRRRKPATIGQYFLGYLLVLDIAVNVIIGGKVRTISERIGQLKHEGRLSRFPVESFIDKVVLESLDPGHSLRAYRANK